MVIFLYNLYIFVWIQHGCLANIVFVLDPSNSVIKRLLCRYYYILDGSLCKRDRSDCKGVSAYLRVPCLNMAKF